jgi:hypothetical protein
MALYQKHEDSFMSFTVRQGVAKGIPNKVMDEVSIEEMLHEAGVNWSNGHILFHHLKHFLEEA